MIMMIMNCRFINKSALRNWLKILLLTLSEFRQSDYFRGNSSWLIHLNLLNINSKIWVPSLSFISSRGSLLQVYFNSNLDPIGEDLNLCRVMTLLSDSASYSSLLHHDAKGFSFGIQQYLSCPSFKTIRWLLGRHVISWLSCVAW